MGPAHDKFNFFFGSLAVGVLIGLQKSPGIFLSFGLGFFVSTWILSPDLDLGPKKRAGLLRLFLYPYSLIMSHRGLSHWPILGTLTRIIYLIFISAVVIFIGHRMNYLTYSAEDFLYSITHILKFFDYEKPVYQWLVWSIGGMLFADCTHLLLDNLSSFWKKLCRIVLRR